MTSSYANIYNPVWQECSLDLVKELIEIKAWKDRQEIERLHIKIYKNINKSSLAFYLKFTRTLRELNSQVKDYLLSEQ